MQVKLFVKYMPHCCSPEKAVSLFLAYGKVHLLEYHSEHRDKLFLVGLVEGRWGFCRENPQYTTSFEFSFSALAVESSICTQEYGLVFSMLTFAHIAHLYFLFVIMLTILLPLLFNEPLLYLTKMSHFYTVSMYLPALL